MVVTVFRGDPGDQPTEDNKIYKLIEEEFGITFEIEFLAGDLDETLGTKFAGEDYPDLFDAGNSAEKAIAAGALMDLLPYAKLNEMYKKGIINVWKEVGWNSIIYISTMASIDPTLYEAASIDGAGRLQRILNVTLPGIKSTFVVLLIMNIGHLMEAGFEIQYLLGNKQVYDFSQTLDRGDKSDG